MHQLTLSPEAGSTQVDSVTTKLLEESIQLRLNMASSMMHGSSGEQCSDINWPLVYGKEKIGG